MHNNVGNTHCPESLGVFSYFIYTRDYNWKLMRHILPGDLYVPLISLLQILGGKGGEGGVGSGGGGDNYNYNKEVLIKKLMVYACERALSHCFV